MFRCELRRISVSLLVKYIRLSVFIHLLKIDFQDFYLIITILPRFYSVIS